jgi:anti-sigma regulatory factor (Ser/Thr protein kinase)
MADEWPLHTFLEFGALPGAVPCARLHARQLLWEWGLAELSDTVQLVVSELLTNAINASRELVRVSPVRLWLLSDRVRVMVLVWDGDPRQPVRADPSTEDEVGRGLLLVEAVSTRWSSCGAGELGGKLVWALIEADSSCS